MTAPAHRVDQCPEEMHILIFTVQGVTMGVDTSQVEELLEVVEAEARRVPVRPIHEAFSFGALPVTYKVPKVITFKDHRGSLAALIDRPDTIAEVKVDAIQALPPLIAARPGASPSIWGAIIRDGEVILLLDFLKLPLSRS
jgi:chemotaxis signal transduction protein